MVLLPFHVAAGVIGLVAGFLALYAAKGAPLHRRAGVAFVGSMVPMALTGMLISALEGVAPMINIPAAVVTLYTVVTAFATVRQPDGTSRIDTAAMWFAFAAAIGCLAPAITAAARGGAAAGMAYPLVLFGGIALAGGVGDRRLIRSRGVWGTARLRRHLWRMCVALLIAALSFFAPPERVPAPLPLRLVPVVAILFTMFYWLWRTRQRRVTRRAVAPAAVNAPASYSAHEVLP